MSEFSIRGYRALLHALRDAGYRFAAFEEPASGPAEAPVVLLRHDVEVDLAAAAMLAECEAHEGVRSTYFISPNTPFFNVLSGAAEHTISRIAQFGHTIGLHVDLLTAGGQPNTLLRDVRPLTYLLPFVNTRLISVHSPPAISAALTEQYPPLEPVYGPILRGEVQYISDSTGRWRTTPPLMAPAFAERRPIHLLTHPVWWCYGGRRATDKLLAALERLVEDRRTTIREYFPKLTKADADLQPD